MGKIIFEPPKILIQDNKTYTYIETKLVNIKGDRLSETCYWYLLGGVRVPFSKGNIEYILSNK